MINEDHAPILSFTKELEESLPWSSKVGFDLIAILQCQH